MALLKSKPSDVPRDAVILTENEALNYQWNMLEGRLRDSTITSIIYGPGILGGLAAASGIYINNHFRTKMRLGKFGFFGSYLPIVVLPGAMAALFHRTFIQSRILLQKDKCPLCLQLRAAGVQSAFGIVYPLVLAPLSSYMFAVRHFTFRLPSITEEPLAVLKVYRKMLRPITLSLSIILGLNAFVAAYMTYREVLSFYKLHYKLLQEEGRMELMD